MEATMKSTIKAYMSEINHGGKGWNLFPQADAALALCEARAILAVSEPGIWIGGPGAACGWAQRDITSKGGPTPTMELSALATALAAFVGEGN
jgi:hypothetical protein